jgi:hypothetical protein
MSPEFLSAADVQYDDYINDINLQIYLFAPPFSTGMNSSQNQKKDKTLS